MSDTSGRRKKPVSAFALARPSADVSAQISVGDVMELRPSWSRQQAAEFLSAYAGIIGGAMVFRGVEVLAALIGVSDGNVN